MHQKSYLHFCVVKEKVLILRQTALLGLVEKMESISLDKKGYAGAIVMDLSKAFDTQP